MLHRLAIGTGRIARPRGAIDASQRHLNNPRTH